MTKRTKKNESISSRESSRKQPRTNNQQSVSSSSSGKKYRCPEKQDSCESDTKQCAIVNENKEVKIGDVEFHGAIAASIVDDCRFVFLVQRLIRTSSDGKTFNDTLAASALKIGLKAMPNHPWDISGCEFHLGDFENIIGTVKPSPIRQRLIQFKCCLFENARIDGLVTTSMKLIERLYRESLECQEEIRKRHVVDKTVDFGHIRGYVNPRHFNELSYVASVECGDKTHVVYPLWNQYEIRTFINGKVNWKTKINEFGEKMYHAGLCNEVNIQFYVSITIEHVKNEWKIRHLSFRIANANYLENVYIDNGFIVIVNAPMRRNEHLSTYIAEPFVIERNADGDSVYKSIASDWEKRCLSVQDGLNANGLIKSKISYDNIFFYDVNCTKMYYCDPMPCFVAIPLPSSSNTSAFDDNEYEEDDDDNLSSL
jgi:hypothetical protein